MSESQARRLAAMLTEQQRRDMLLLASILQAESEAQQTKFEKK